MDRALLDKIAKLLALAASSNEHEARLAAIKASELLVKHNLSEQEVRAHAAREYDHQAAWKGARKPPEHNYVQAVLRTYFFVEVVAVRVVRNGCSIMLFGTPTNVAVGKYIYVFLVREFRSLWAVYRKANRLRAGGRKAYYYGLLAGLTRQLADVRRETEAAAGAIVKTDAGLSAFVEATLPGTRTVKSRKRRPRVSRVYAAGFADGENLRIRRSVEDRLPVKGGALCAS